MASTINIRYASTDVPLPAPQWGYRVTVKYPFTKTRLDNGFWAIWDNGANYDRRYLSCSWLLEYTNAAALVDIFQDAAKGRNATLTLKLGTASGFYPFGPDKGDSGDFQVVVQNVSPLASRGHPGDLFQVDVDFIFVGSYPAYTIPAAIYEGNLSIGTVVNLRYPEGMHTQTVIYKVPVVDTMNYSAYGNDRAATADNYESALALDLFGSNMGRLVDFLSGASGRATNISVTPPANAYLFGIENGSTATYVCSWLDDELEIVHTNHDQFSASLNFGLISAA